MHRVLFGYRFGLCEGGLIWIQVAGDKIDFSMVLGKSAYPFAGFRWLRCRSRVGRGRTNAATTTIGQARNAMGACTVPRCSCSGVNRPTSHFTPRRQPEISWESEGFFAANDGFSCGDFGCWMTGITHHGKINRPGNVSGRCHQYRQTMNVGIPFSQG